METSGKYPRTYHFSFSEGTTNDDKVQHDLNILLSKPLVYTEKLDGSNTMINMHGVYGRSHTEPTQNAWMRNVWDKYYIIKDYIDDGVEIYGENLYGIHSIEYSGLHDHFYIFGIKDGDKWLSWTDVEYYSELFEIPTVPVLQKINEVDIESMLDSHIQQIVKYHMNIPSKLSDDGIFKTPKEGVVVRTQSPFLNNEFAEHLIKYVRKDHVQTDKHWRVNWRRAKLNHELKY